MSEDYIQDYVKAGKAVIAAKKLAKRLIKPDTLFLEIANKCEAEIINNGCKLAFPVNICLDNITAHYSPPIEDKTIVPEKGLLKIDIGAHHNGYIADSAFTINIDNDAVLQNYVEAAIEGLEAAIALFKPGTKLFELGEAIAEKIFARGLRPITNLGGHELKQNVLHAGPFIPNFKDLRHKNVLKPGDAYACEPFVTSASGRGMVKNGPHSYIYRFVKKIKKNMPYEQIGYMNKIESYCKRLPFSPRFIENNQLIPKNKIERTINAFVGKKILDHYPIFIEMTGEPVAQCEHTMVIDMEGQTIVTTRE